MAGFQINVLHDRRKIVRIGTALLAGLAIAFCLVAAPAAQGQNDKKKKKKKDPPTVNNDDANPVVPLTDQQQIDYMLSEYLAAWQLGDTERLHKFYAEDVSVVSGGWNAPVVGWSNFLALYEQERAHMQKIRMDRMNTFIRVNGTTAWACYQWEFEAVMDGTPAGARGQTTLVLTKKETRWLIAHDHTSVVQVPKQEKPAGTPAPAAGAASKPPSQ
ncbi:MAG TPA: nuclear transport factor 2 family protein [Candidatus Acidoferrum sp.]|nr:nuclear transport factor 2 family protein [Candidatus Acidoferrum sp.]